MAACVQSEFGEGAGGAGRIRNDRILAVPIAARREVTLTARIRQEIEQFFIAATTLEAKEPRLLGWGDADAALALIRSSASQEPREKT